MKRLAYLIPALVLPLLALAPAPADAGCRRVAVQQALAQHQAAVVVQPAVVATTFLAVPTPAYPVLGATYGQGDIAAEIRQLRQELAAEVRAAAGAPAVAPASPAPSAPTVPGPAKPPAAMPRADAQASPSPAAAWEGTPALLAAVKTSCARCHGAANPKGGLSLVTAAGELAPLPELARLRAFAAVADGSMPQGGTAPPDEVLALFREWSKLK